MNPPERRQRIALFALVALLALTLAGLAVALVPRHAPVRRKLGPPPVVVPQLVGMSATEARTLLANLKLTARVSEAPGPGMTTGMVMRQSPAALARRAPRSTIALTVAQPPALRPLGTFSGAGSAVDGPFRIQGSRWEITYSMHYVGTCTFIVICSGPTATVTNAATGTTVEQFGLDDGGRRSQIVHAGPGRYRITVSPGDDDAAYSVAVDDYY